MSGDIALVFSDSVHAADFNLADDDLVTDPGLRTAILLSLFTDRRSEDGDDLPVGATDRRGWWADEFNDVAGDKFGSRLWLLARSKREASVLVRAQDYALEALKWLIDDRVALSVDVEAEFLSQGPGLGLTVTVVRPTKDRAVYKFGSKWDVEEARI